MVFDYSKVRGRMREKNLTLRTLAPIIGITYQVLSAKLSNGLPIRSDQIFKMAEILDINDDEIGAYFFVIRGQHY